MIVSNTPEIFDIYQNLMLRILLAGVCLIVTVITLGIIAS